MSSHKPWADSLPLDRLIWTLDVVHREGGHLLYSWRSIFEGESQPDATWVAALDKRPEEAVRLEAFVSRFGRMQDTMADKLIPRWLDVLAESPGSPIENLNPAELSGVTSSTENSLTALQLRSRPAPASIRSSSAFAPPRQLPPCHR